MLKRRDILASIEERVESLLKEKIEAIGYELYDVEYSKEGKNYFLRIFIDKTGGIDLNDCEKVNNEIDEILDEADYIKEQYFLEVSSPGIERIIRKEKHLKKYIGHEINIKLFKKDKNGNKEYQGILKAFDQENIELEENIKIERKNIAQIKTVYNW
jgi:ribosome maturation factor RimP